MAISAPSRNDTPSIGFALLVLVALGLLGTAAWAGGLFGPVAGGPILTGIAIVSTLIALGFLAVAFAVNRLSDSMRTGVAAEPVGARASTGSVPFSPWRASTTALVAALGATLAFLGIAGWAISQFDRSIQLPIVIVVTLVALLGAVAFVVISFGIFRLTNKDQALGLPPGSVQAIIALSLILLFVTLTVFLVLQMGRPGGIRDIEVDISKQVLTVLGTLVTAVSSFYFGSRSTTDAVRSTQPPTGSQGATANDRGTDTNGPGGRGDTAGGRGPNPGTTGGRGGAAGDRGADTGDVPEQFSVEDHAERPEAIAAPSLASTP